MKDVSLSANRNLCYAVTGLAWVLYTVSYVRSALFTSIENFLFSIAIASTVLVYSLKFCDLIILASPQTKFQKIWSVLTLVIMVAFFSFLLLSFPLNITLALASAYWFYLGSTVLILTNHHMRKLKKTHPMFYYSSLHTGYYLAGTGFFLICLQFTEIIQVSEVLEKMLVGDIIAISIFISSALFLFIAVFRGCSLIGKSLGVSRYLSRLAKSKKKKEIKLFRKLTNDSWASEVDSVMKIIHLSRLTLPCQGFLVLILFFSTWMLFLTTSNFAYITIIVFLFFSLTASFNYFARSYGYRKLAILFKDLVAVTPSKKVADNILNFLITLGTALALGAVTLPIIPIFLMVDAYIVFVYFLLVAFAALVGKIVNPKYRSKIAMVLYYVFFCGTGGFTGLIAAAFGIPPLIDAFIAGTILAFSTFFNAFIMLKLSKVKRARA